MPLRHQILIASYAKDFPWLRHCLRSLEKFSTGFLPPVVAVPMEDLAHAWNLVREIGSSATVRDWDGVGFGRAQSAMMHGDILCPDADYYWLLGSDCLAVAPFSPETYCHDEGRPYMLYHTWEHLEKHGRECLFWRAGTEAALGWKSHGEFMRRLPLAYRGITVAAMRDWVGKNAHPRDFDEYVTHEVNVNRNFSESNVMGEWAWKRATTDYVWVNLDGYVGGEGAPTWANWPTVPIVQHWSHGGLDRPRDQDGRTPRSVIVEALGSL